MIDKFWHTKFGWNFAIFLLEEKKYLDVKNRQPTAPWYKFLFALVEFTFKWIFFKHENRFFK